MSWLKSDINVRHQIDDGQAPHLHMFEDTYYLKSSLFQTWPQITSNPSSNSGYQLAILPRNPPQRQVEAPSPHSPGNMHCY